MENLQEKEIQDLMQDEQVYDLESLITDGANSKIPVEITYKNKTYGAILRPLTNVEWNNASRESFKNKKTTGEIELLKKGLYTKQDKPFPKEILETLPSGVIMELAKKLADISGIKIDQKANEELVRRLMGF